MKELTRRNSLNRGPMIGMKPWDVKRLVNELEGTSSNDEDINSIKKGWGLLKEDMQDYYFQSSCDSDAAVFHHVRSQNDSMTPVYSIAHKVYDKEWSTSLSWDVWPKLNKSFDWFLQ